MMQLKLNKTTLQRKVLVISVTCLMILTITLTAQVNKKQNDKDASTKGKIITKLSKEDYKKSYKAGKTPQEIKNSQTVEMTIKKFALLPDGIIKDLKNGWKTIIRYTVESSTGKILSISFIKYKNDMSRKSKKTNFIEYKINNYDELYDKIKDFHIWIATKNNKYTYTYLSHGNNIKFECIK